MQAHPEFAAAGPVKKDAAVFQRLFDAVARSGARPQS